ncbi:MAG: ATP-binding protein, partial [Microvirga sp.]
MTGTNLAHLSMQDLFRVEARAQAQALTDGLLTLEKEPRRADQLEACMRAAHSLKGAARIVDIGGGVTVAHAMEELFVAAQDGLLLLTQRHIDALLKGVDLLTAIANAPGSGEDEAWEDEADRYATMLARVEDIPEPAAARSVPAAPPPPPSPPPAVEPADSDMAAGERAMRVSADNLNRLLDLAGESLVESRRLKPLAQSLLRLKRLHRQAAQSLESLRETLTPQATGGDVGTALLASERAILACKQFLIERLAEFEAAEHHATALAHRLYDQALTVRMRPFADGVTAFPRMVRDVGRSLGKNARLEVVGLTTQVDRDIMERLDAPLGHLLRNAVDHGLETTAERDAAGKPGEGVIVLEAHHSAGTLQILVSDDGRGIDLERLRATVIRRKLATEDTAAHLSEAELLEFLFLPGFTMKDEVTRISGRGVGLDVVRDMVKQVGGLVQVTSRPGRGTRFQLQLPLTLSVIRALLVEIGGETYAFSFGQILRAIKVERDEVGVTEGRQFFTLGEKKVGLAAAHQILDMGEPPSGDEAMCVVVI